VYLASILKSPLIIPIFLLLAVGNRNFRDIVAEAIPGYVSATSRATKTEIVTAIVRQVMKNGGRFLKQDSSRKVWYVLNYTQSKEKTGHAIRDATITDDSKKQRAKKRKLMRAASSAQSVRRVSCGSRTYFDKHSDDESITSNDTEGEEEDYSAMKALLTDVRSLDYDLTPVDCLSSVLLAHFPEKHLPEDIPSSTCMDPLPIEDPYNSYIDQLLGPLAEF
jgi:hypothetical protein